MLKSWKICISQTNHQTHRKCLTQSSILSPLEDHGSPWITWVLTTRIRGRGLWQPGAEPRAFRRFLRPQLRTEAEAVLQPV